MTQFMSLSGTPLSLLYINSSPSTFLSETQWTKWIKTEHIPSLIDSKAVFRAALYKEAGFGMIPNPFHSLKFLLLCQTDSKFLQDSEQYHQACQRSGMIEDVAWESASDTRNYELNQNYNPYGVRNTLGPSLPTIEMDPDDRDDFEDMYRTELLPNLSTLPGYRRCLRYQITKGAQADTDAGEYLAIHETEDLNKAFPSEARHEEATTPRIERHIKASKRKGDGKGGGFVRRGWQLVHGQGFDEGTADQVMKTEQDHPRRIFELDASETQIKLEDFEDRGTSEQASCLGLGRFLLRLLGRRMRQSI